jgi:uncharacterized repeat protein (TIGR01451 family)
VVKGGIAVRRYLLATMALQVAVSLALGQTLPPLDKRGGPVAPGELPMLTPPANPANLKPLATSGPVIATPTNPGKSIPAAVKDLDLLKPVPMSPIRKPAVQSKASAPNEFQILNSSASPLVTVELIAPPQSNVGQVTPFELVVRNHGKSAVYQVRLEQEVPPGMHYVSAEPQADVPGDRIAWDLGILDAGAEKRIKLNMQCSAEGEIRSKATVTYSASCATTTKFTRAKIAVKITGPESAMVGDPVNFQIHIANNGSGPIGKLLLRNVLPAGLTHPAGNILEAEIANLGPGESRNVTLRTTASKSGQYTNEIQAMANGAAVLPTGGIRNPDLEATARVQIRLVEPGLQVRLSGPKSCFVKCEGVFSIDLTNPGSAATRNVRLTNRIPDGMDFVAASDEGRYDATTRTVNWALPLLEPGAHKVVTVKVRGAAMGDSGSAVVAQADGKLNARAEMPVKIEGIPALSLEVVDLDDPAPVGTDLTYEIRVLNQGTCPCTGIQIVALMPEGMELREASAPAAYKLLGQQVQFGAHAKLATKADLVYRLKVRSKSPGDVRFRVQLTCDQLQQPVFKEESTRFFQP